MELRRVEGRAYLQPLREGGSLPAVVETDEGLFVTKFRGAGHGALALVAELVVGLLARALDLPVPELALVDLDEDFGADRRDPEIQDILAGSRGLNVGLRYLDGAFNFDLMAAGDLVPPPLAADVVWLDAFVTNPDRTARNPNLLIHERRPWLIDHGTALYAHHAWDRVDEARTRGAFPLIREHVLLERAADPGAADARLAPRVTPELLAGILGAVPDGFFTDPVHGSGFRTAAEARARYASYLTLRLTRPRRWVDEAVAARRRRLDTPARRLEARR